MLRHRCVGQRELDLERQVPDGFPWTTSLNDTTGVKPALVEVANMEGSSVLTLCGSASVSNPNW
ncbi:hypothetical protein [Streptomyces sp. NPDC006368]|uniref:hypothetical protein n=1 Tax=Streptomyces sp. NPDC006368 TaxID=3156760 RepID=UPI00339E0063